MADWSGDLVIMMYVSIQDRENEYWEELIIYFINKFNNVYWLKAYHVILNNSTILREIAVIRK